MHQQFNINYIFSGTRIDIKMFSLVLCLVALPNSYSYSYSDTFDETLLIKPLPTGHVYTQFQFTVNKDLNAGDGSQFLHFRLFPRSLGEIITEYDVQELHFSLTQGLWRHEKWGYPVRDAPPGAELWTLFKGNISKVSSNWKTLTNVLSGQFCASLNFIDDTSTAIPKLSFRPEGAVNGDYNSSFVRYAALPRENICTENLTPFRKLLPCGAQAGLTTLLNAINVFNAHFVSIAVDVKTICKENCSSIAIQAVQSVAVVFEPPVQLQKKDWSFVKLFGSSLISTCPVARNSKVFVDMTSITAGNNFTLNVQPTELIYEEYDNPSGSKGTELFALYDLKHIFKSTNYINLAAIYSSNHIYGIVPPPVLHVDRKISGYGQEQGGIHCTFFNNHPKKHLKILYFDVIPWYLRLYSHTLMIKSGSTTITPDYLHYQPAKDRGRPHHLEFVVTLPLKSKTEMSIDFDFAFLKWTEYPPDANHGFYVGSAVVTTLLDTSKNFSYFPGHKQTRVNDGNFLRIHTKILLVSLPTPDFSMPYNVICLTCTVVALAFGPIHNITTRSLQPFEEDKEVTFLAKIKKKVKEWWKGTEKTEKESEEDSKKTQ